MPAGAAGLPPHPGWMMMAAAGRCVCVCVVQARLRH